MKAALMIKCSQQIHIHGVGVAGVRGVLRRSDLTELLSLLRTDMLLRGVSEYLQSCTACFSGHLTSWSPDLLIPPWLKHRAGGCMVWTECYLQHAMIPEPVGCYWAGVTNSWSSPGVSHTDGGCWTAGMSDIEGVALINPF